MCVLLLRILAIYLPNLAYHIISSFCLQETYSALPMQCQFLLTFMTFSFPLPLFIIYTPALVYR